MDYTKSELVMSDYNKGFAAGEAFILHEIERYIEQREYEPRIALPLKNLLAHLKMEDRQPRETT
jgi:hypothetical protein